MKGKVFKLDDAKLKTYHPGTPHEYDDKGYCVKCWEIILKRRAQGREDDGSHGAY